MSINFIPGYNVKPDSIDEFGVVSFTDGTNIMSPNQQQCQAYGYRYDIATGTCYAFTFNRGVTTSSENFTNIIRGAQNTTEIGTSNTYIMGDKNNVKGNSRNNIIVGNYNEISSGVNNAAVLGSYGVAQRPGEVVMGGGGGSLGKNQSSTIHLSGTTTDASATSLFLNGDSTQTVIARDDSENNFSSFEAHITGVRTGGTAAGNVFDRIYLKADGLVYLKASSQQARDRGNFGTVTGWTAAVAFTGTNDMVVQVTGAANMEITWACTFNLYEMII